MVLLFIKLTNMRDDKERQVPLEEFLSYSTDKTQDENDASIAKERSMIRSINVTKVIVPVLTLIGGISGTKNVIDLIRYGYDASIVSELLRDAAFLLLALLFAIYAVRAVNKKKRFATYMGIIKRRNFISLDVISDATGYDINLIESDLQEMINRLYFGKAARIDAEKQILYCR
ncbi:MAG: hypothetical protein KBS83_03940 [Lachnospiraceae bacterium]|nr:hypothetical protein [Candidatus Equihabitans merdae]